MISDTINITQGYPDQVIGELKKTKSGWYFYINKKTNMIHESTLRRMLKYIEDLEGNK